MTLNMKIKIPDILRITNPLWVEKLLTRETWDEVNDTCYINGKKLNIGSYECCVVGEALNLFDVDYDEFCEEYGDVALEDIGNKYHRGCEDCSRLSMTIYNKISSMRFNKDDVLRVEVVLEEFAKHLEKLHPDIIEAKKNE